MTDALIYDLANLWMAFGKASKGRRSHPSIAAFEYNLEGELIQLRDELRDGAYQSGRYRNFTVHEPKRRKISAAPFLCFDLEASLPKLGNRLFRGCKRIRL